MTVSDAQGILDEDAPVNSGSDDGSMAELRSLLLGPAEAQLAEVHTRLFDPQRQVEEVSWALPDAIGIRSRQDDKLTTALAPTVAAALEHSVRKDPQPLADAIFPVMGPAIRRSIAAALSGMVQSFNHSLTHSLSLRGLRWRLEALRTGRPFAEVVLLHTLLFRVEQVFLIHKETGLLLRHVPAGMIAVQDADMVSGMLTAIQDFVQDSFSPRRGDQLEALQVGDLTVWVEQGPLAILASVIRGNAPQELREVFQQTLERIHLQYGAELKEFGGDAAQFGATGSLLEDCLRSGYDLEQQAAGSARRLTPFRIAASILLVAALLWGFFWFRDRRRWTTYVETLKSEPGIIVTEAESHGGKYFISGLRDPLARDPRAIMRGTGLNAEAVVDRWQPFQALTPDFVLARARSLLEPPATVKLRVKDSVLEAEGFASHQWVVETRRAARLLPGLGQFREDELLDLERIENPLLMFELDKTELRPGQEEKLNRLVADIQRLEQLTVAKNVRLEIAGHTDGSGTEARNGTLSQGRANVIAATLQARLRTSTNLTTTAVGSKEKLREEVSEADRAANRSVTFKVVVTDAH